jgi:sirohydrochlorin ferrochelatase
MASSDAARTIPALLQRQADRHGDHPLVRAGGKERTVAEIRQAAAQRAGALAAAGSEDPEGSTQSTEGPHEFVTKTTQVRVDRGGNMQQYGRGAETGSGPAER